MTKFRKKIIVVISVGWILGIDCHVTHIHTIKGAHAL